MYNLSSKLKITDWHYQHIAQMLDAKTAICLARMPNADKRFFMGPPYYHVQHKLYVCIINFVRKEIFNEKIFVLGCNRTGT